MNSSDYAKDKDRGAVQADLPPGRKGHEELQLQLPKHTFFKGVRREPKCKWFNPKPFGGFLHTGARSN